MAFVLSMTETERVFLTGVLFRNTDRLDDLARSLGVQIGSAPDPTVSWLTVQAVSDVGAERIRLAVAERVKVSAETGRDGREEPVITKPRSRRGKK